MKHYRKILLFLFLVALPWQTRWIVEDIMMQTEVSQYGRLSIYAFDVLLVAFLLASAHVWTRKAWDKIKASKPHLYAFVSLDVLMAVALVSTFWALEPRVALFAAGHIILAGMLFVTLVIDKEVSPDLVLGGIGIGLIAPGLLAWIQSAQQSVFASTILGIAAQDPDVLGTAVLEYEGGRWLRAYGSFSHPNILGGYMAFGLMAIFSVVARAKMKALDMPLALAAVLAGGALVMSASRAGWIALAIGLVWLYELTMKGRSETFRQRMQYTLLLSMGVMLVIGFSLRGPLVSRIQPENRLEVISNTERVEQWDEAKRLLQRTSTGALIGVGTGNYVFALEQVRPLHHAYAYQPIHNVPALVFVELGVLGGLALIVFIVATDWLPHKGWRHPSGRIAMSLGLIVLVLSLFDHYLWTQPTGVYLLAIFFALNLRLGEEAVSHS